MTTPAPQPLTPPVLPPGVVPPPGPTSVEGELRALVTQIRKATSLGFDPSQWRKAIITAVDASTTPPTVTLNMDGDTTVSVSSVRFMDNATPFVGDTVLVSKQKSDILVVGKVASHATSGTQTSQGWIQATLAAGSHNGNSNGNVYYRRVLDHGAWKMQWQGGWTVSGGTLMNAGVLPAEYRPRTRRSCLVARHIQTGAVAAQLDFNSDGAIGLVGATTTPDASSSSVDPGDSTSSVDPIDSTTTDSGHSHGVVGSHSHSVTGSHSHSIFLTVSTPNWISLNGVEYFL